MAAWSSSLSRGVLSSVPVVGASLNHLSGFPPILWPPLGSINFYASALATALIASVGFYPIRSIEKGVWKRRAVFGLIVCVVSLLAYAYFLSTFVKAIETPNNGTQYRTVGSQRTEMALNRFPGATDGQLLRVAGLNDDDIEKMWTPSSVTWARLKLFLSYLFGLTSINFVWRIQSYLGSRRPR